MFCAGCGDDPDYAVSWNRLGNPFQLTAHIYICEACYQAALAELRKQPARGDLPRYT